jgi:hypothetical protein
MPPDENIHQENHFSQDAERLNSLLFELRKEKDFNPSPYLEDPYSVYKSKSVCQGLKKLFIFFNI